MMELSYLLISFWQLAHSTVRLLVHCFFFFADSAPISDSIAGISPITADMLIIKIVHFLYCVS